MAPRGTRKRPPGLAPQTTYVDRMDRSDRGQIPNFIQATFAVASFFIYLAGSLGPALAVPITFGLALAALRLRVCFLGRTRRQT